MLRPIWLGVGLSLSLLSVNQCAWSASQTVPINAANYDIYTGDIDNNGYVDFYFKAKPLFVLLHGQIATPLLIPKLGLDLMVLRNGNTLASAIASTLTAAQVDTKIQSNLLALAQPNSDYIVVNEASLIVQTAGSSVTNSFTYDALGRLTNMSDTVNGDRKYIYDPAGNRTNVSVRVLGNRAPTVVGESVTIPYQTTKFVNVLSNDSDPDGDPISLKSFTSCGIASVSQSGNGLNIFAIYGPSSCSLTYTVADDRGATSVATIVVTVN